METDFLNLHDEEHFGTGLYQSEFFDDSQSSILDIVGDDYSRQDSTEYMDNSVIWEQDVEREINGDVAVIPMTSTMNTFPKLSNSPPTKDFHKLFSDWQEHLASIETTEQDLSVDLHLNGQNLDINLDYITPIQPHIIPQSSPKATLKIEPPNSPKVTISDPSTSPKHSHFPTIDDSEHKFKKKDIKPPVRSGGKNLALLKAVVKEELDLDSSFKSEGSTDDFDSVNDHFDITSYVIGQDYPSNKNIKKERSENGSGSYGKNIDNYTNEDIKHEQKIKLVSDDNEDDHIDVETVSEPSEMPVLEARDLNTLLEQFEASEAVNPKLPQNLFDSEEITPKNDIVIHKEPEIKIVKTEKKKDENKNNKVITPNKTINKNIRDSLPIELIQKIKASSCKKSISVIPAMPKKSRSRKENVTESKNKLLKINSESIQLDHDYCSLSPIKLSRRNSSDSDKKSPERKKIDKVIITPEDKKQIEDTSTSIEEQIKNAISKQKHKTDILKYQPTVKNANGQIMVSLLKTNRNINTPINNVNDAHKEAQQCAKKRKLNLEEYKRLRGEILKSCENSGSTTPNSGIASPASQTTTDNEEKIRQHQELMMKLASEILKTPAKSNKNVSEAKLEEFVPPEARKVEETPKIEPLTPPKPLEEFELLTIVSIGVNTDDVQIEKKPEAKPITFKIIKKNNLQRNKFFEGSENEESPKKEPAVNNSKLTQIITPILQNASAKIHSNSLITNITATLLQQSPKISPKYETSVQKVDSKSKTSPKYEHNLKTNCQKLKNDISPKIVTNDQKSVDIESPEHGEDKTVIVLKKNRVKPIMVNVEVQTDEVVFIEEKVKEKEKEKEKVKEKPKEKLVRQYRNRRSSSSSSSGSNSSVKCKSSGKSSRQSRRSNHRTSSSNSLSSSLGSRWSRSRSRSRSRSHSVYSQSSYYSSSSRSRSRSISPSRWHSRSHSRSRYFKRSRSRSRYSHSRIRSRSPSRRRRVSRDNDQERMREVEERRVIYVGKISNGTTKADLRRRFQSFGPITNVSVHFRDHGDNYGFVTFAYKVDAYEAVEHGNDEPNVPKYDISFGGRRAFCKTRYSDLDNIETEAMNPAIFRQEPNDSFDMLLREAQAKLRKRKV